MSAYTIGSLFSGYGGLDMGVQPVEGGHLIQLQDAEGALCAAVAVTDDALVARHTEGGDGQ